MHLQASFFFLTRNRLIQSGGIGNSSFQTEGFGTSDDALSQLEADDKVNHINLPTTPCNTNSSHFCDSYHEGLDSDISSQSLNYFLPLPWHGFEHEILDIILRMEEKRKNQIQEQKKVKNCRKGKNKADTELKKLAWDFKRAMVRKIGAGLTKVILDESQNTHLECTGVEQ
ncbi:hypothetical protein KY290_033114 [Solanum tuberosum]|uniref:Uncharacterized protein n=1 Tax=Solanum tuberosum TaxID=4113 RepID=A0ABQ7U153_SOLTU|nr:hypothetical protein KY285_032366 [Solanum tuberosum]KAH0740071.1 hypothetical protein KY290_033114 [Solanum tuberosum]